MQDTIYQVPPCTGEVGTGIFDAEAICAGLARSGVPCDPTNFQAELTSAVYVNGLRRSLMDLVPCYSEDPRPRLFPLPVVYADREVLAWTVYREMRRRYFGSPTKRMDTLNESLLNDSMFVPFRDALNLDPLDVYTRHFRTHAVNLYPQDEPVAWHRLAVAAIVYCSLFDRSATEVNTFLTYIKEGRPEWIEFVIQIGYTQILPQLLDLDPIYTSANPRAALLAELNAWKETGGYNPGQVSAPPAKPPPRTGWVPSIWPVIDSITGAVVTVPALPPPCTPFPNCVLSKVPGLDAPKMWTIIKTFVANTTGVTLIFDEKGLRFVPPKRPKTPSKNAQNIVRAAYLEYGGELPPPEPEAKSGMSGLAIAGIAGLGVVAAALLAVGLSDD